MMAKSPVEEEHSGRKPETAKQTNEAPAQVPEGRCQTDRYDSGGRKEQRRGPRSAREMRVSNNTVWHVGSSVSV